MEALATDASPLSMICCSRDRMCLLFCWISRSKFSICYKDVCQYYEQLYNVYKNRLQNPAAGNVILHVMHVNSEHSQALRLLAASKFHVLCYLSSYWFLSRSNIYCTDNHCYVLKWNKIGTDEKVKTKKNDSVRGIPGPLSLQGHLLIVRLIFSANWYQMQPPQRAS